MSTYTSQNGQNSPTPRFSVIIPTYNSIATLIPLLESLKKQTLPDFEVILVDDGSTDGTENVVGQYDIQYHRMPERRGPAAARNYGAKLARSEWLVFTDADTLFADDTVERIDRSLQECTMDALVGTYAGKPANTGFMPRYKALWEALAIDGVLTAHNEKFVPYTAWAPRPGVVRKEVFERLGGFNESFHGADLEDIDLGYRMAAAGYRNYFVPDIRIQHHYPATFAKEIRSFSRRCTIWMQMNREHGFFDASGEGTPRQALVHIAGFSAFLLFFAGAIIPLFHVVAALLLIIYFYASRGFILRAWQEEGCWFAVRAAVVCWIHTIVLGVSASYGTGSRKRA